MLLKTAESNAQPKLPGVVLRILLLVLLGNVYQVLKVVSHEVVLCRQTLLILLLGNMHQVLELLLLGNMHQVLEQKLLLLGNVHTLRLVLLLVANVQPPNHHVARPRNARLARGMHRG